MTATVVTTALQLGALYAIVALAVTIAFRFMSFPDLTPDGSFVAGACITSRFIVDGYSWPFATAAAVAIGVAAGLLTATIAQLFRINKFFAGILSAMVLYSANLRILGGANLSLYRRATVFSAVENSDSVTTMATLACYCLCAFVVILMLLTRLGLRLRGFGVNAEALRERPLSMWLLVACGLGAANGLAALAGSLIAQYQHFADVNMGIGVAISGFAALFLGESVVLAVGAVIRQVGWRRSRRPRSIAPLVGELVAAGVGSVSLLLITTWILGFALAPSDLKSVAALILLICMAFRRRSSPYMLAAASKFE